MKKEQMKMLFDSRFIKVVDIEYEPGRHYYNATRREIDDLAAVKTDEAFREMTADAVTCVLILLTEDGPRLLMSYEFRYPAGRYLLSPAAGLIDPEDRHAPCPAVTAARREIFEETGLHAAADDPVFVVNPLVFSTPGMSDESNAVVCAVIRHPDLAAITQNGAVGSEKFAGYRLLSAADAERILREGRDEYGNFYPVYAMVVMMYFVGGQWKSRCGCEETEEDAV